jgi:fatty aldehyde-generating acyl-ACP reductase
MKFATLGHLMIESDIQQIPKEWIHNNWIYSPEINLNQAKGRITGLKLTAEQIMSQPLEEIRNKILELSLFLQNKFDVNLIQLGALTTSVTEGGVWLTNQKEYTGYINHGDSYTAAITCQATIKALNLVKKYPSDLTLSIVGAYGIIGEAVSKILVPQFSHSILIGRRENKLKELQNKLDGDFEITTDLKTKETDIIITATSHPTALLNSDNLKKNAIIIDVSQPPNLSYDLFKKRSDIIRIDGGFVDIPANYPFQIPGIPSGKIFSCVAEIIMQSIENEQKNYVGSINLKHLKKTEKWAQKYGFTFNELTNFGKKFK